MDSVIVKPVETKDEMKQFIKLPFDIYKGDEAWVPPLILERKEHFSKKNPFFEHAKVQFFLAFKNGECVGRITAHIDYLYIEQHNEKCGFFGFIEGVDDIEVFRQLLNTAEEWLKKEGMEHVIGPMSFSTNDEVGLLIDSFDIPPTFMLSHAKPYYKEHIEALGYKKEKDLNCYYINLDQDLPLMENLVEKTKSKIEVKPVDKSKVYETSKLLKEIFNDSWKNNWGYIPFTDNEFYYLVKQLKHIVEKDFVNVAYYKGEPAGMYVLFPDLNEIIKDFNGRLTPINIIKFLYRLKQRRYSIFRAALLGVRSKYHQNMLATALISHLILNMKKNCLSIGIKYLDVSWVLEDNKGVIDLLVKLGNAKMYKTFRVYGKSLV